MVTRQRSRAGTGGADERDNVRRNVAQRQSDAAPDATGAAEFADLGPRRWRLSRQRATAATTRMASGAGRLYENGAKMGQPTTDYHADGFIRGYRSTRNVDEPRGGDSSF